MSPPLPDADVTFTMRALPVEGCWSVHVRLRLLLKIALRCFKLKCIEIKYHDQLSRTDNGPPQETRTRA